MKRVITDRFGRRWVNGKCCPAYRKGDGSFAVETWMGWRVWLPHSGGYYSSPRSQFEAFEMAAEYNLNC